MNEQQRSDKHLLPTEAFYTSKIGPKIDDKEVNAEFFANEKQFKLPYGSIDLIFNHKNVWANL
jgi:hypothetical protein